MNRKERQGAATATFGLTGVAGAAALRHTALEQAYDKGKRPPVLQELKMLRNNTKGRGRYASGMLVGAASTPAAVTGISTLMAGKRRPVAKSGRKRSFLAEGADGVANSIRESGNTVKEPPPARLALANYLGGGAVTALAGAGINHKLAGAKLPGAAKASLAAMGAVTSGAATLPIQSKVMSRFSGGQYETTAHGVRRKKAKAIPASAKATTVDARGNPSPMSKSGAQVYGRMPIPVKAFRSAKKGQPGRLIESHHAAMWDAQSRNQSAVAQAHQGFIRELDALPAAHSRKPALAAGLAAGGAGVGAVEAARRSRVKKYYGEDMSHATKRARVGAVAGVPVVSDFAQAGLAARMAPPGTQKKTAAQVYGGGQVGGAVGTGVGAYGAAALARRSKRFEAGTAKVDGAIDSGKASLRSAVGLKPKTDKPSLRSRALAKTPGFVQRAAATAAKPLAGHGKAAAVGGLALGAVGGQIGSQTGYGFALRAEDKHKAKIARDTRSARRGTRVAKADLAVMTPRQQAKLRRSKEQSAFMSQAGGALGLTALGATVGSKVGALGAKTTGRLAKVPVPLLTAGAGLGGINAFKYADIQRKEAHAKVRKSYNASTQSYIPIKAMSRLQRHGIKHRLKPEHGMRKMPLHARPAPPSAAGRMLWPGHGPTDMKGTAPHISREEIPNEVLSDKKSYNIAGDARPNGRGGGHIRINPVLGRGQEIHPIARKWSEALESGTLAHEKAHTAPKRNIHTFQRRMSQSGALGREEGRADMLATGKDTYPGNPAFRAGYEEVQGKIRAAQRKKTLTKISALQDRINGFGKGLVPGIRRAPRIARGSLRQTRNPSTGAVRTSYARGGIR